jgi:hypothetical protein
VQTTTFADLLVVSLRLQRATWSGVERGTRTMLHLCNLPARTDVDRLSRNVAAMRHELRQMSVRLDEQARGR